MNIKRVILFLTGFLLWLTVHSQSVYHLQYNFNSASDSVNYHVFLLRFDDGSGLLRVRYRMPVTGQDILVESDLGERMVTDKSGLPDTSVMVLASERPRFIIGDNRVVFKPPVFFFYYNSGTGFFEPGKVGLTDSDNEAVHFLSARLMERAALTRPFVLQFFSEDEDFFVNLFHSGTKGLTAAEKNTRLYLVAVGDTLDKSIGSSCRMDVERIVETFTGLTGYLGIRFSSQVIWGRSYSKRNVELALKNLKVSSNDIVVFYYSGHGFKKDEESRRFPYIKLKTLHRNKRDVYANSLNMEDIFNTIKTKGARFNLVLSDCCNDEIITTNVVGSTPGKTKSSQVDWSEDNLRTLFLNQTPSSILMTAAMSGQRASSNNRFGGFFSYFFKLSMENYCSKLKKNVNWINVLQDTQKMTINKASRTYCNRPYVPSNICRQNPDFKIMFGN